MKDNVVPFTGTTRLDLDPERLLKYALNDGKLTEVVILGYSEDGEEYFAFSSSDGGSVLWHLERAKMKLLGSVDQQ